MHITYSFPFQAKCPSDPAIVDTYDCTIVSTKMILVEGIKAMVEKYTAEPVYQEDLTHDLAVALQADVTLVGEHLGVKVHSVAYAAK